MGKVRKFFLTRRRVLLLLGCASGIVSLVGSGQVLATEAVGAAASITNASTASTTLQSGAFVASGSPGAIAGWDTATGTRSTIATDYLPMNKGWAGMDGSGSSLSWMFTRGWTGSAYTLSLGVPIIPTNSNGTAAGTLAAGATGAYNSYFVTLAQTLIANGESNADLRLGWEFSGTWYAWSATTPAAEANFVLYFDQIVTAMRTVPGENFKFVWNPSARAFTAIGSTVEAAYPGNAFVDYVGLDSYDQTWLAPHTPANSWSLTTLPALTAAHNFAAAMGKPLAMTEWGLATSAVNGLGDDPLYIKSMIDWLENPANNVAYESYFDSGYADLTGGADPNGLAAFVATWGSPDFSFNGLSVTSVSPSSGSPSGGTRVTVTGSDFTGATKVTFAGVAGTNLTVVNDSTLTVTSPPNAPRTDDVLVTTKDGTSVAVGADHFTYLVPTVSGIFPSSGPSSGGTSVTVTGSDFTGATNVTFAGVAGTNVNVVNDTTLTVTSPPHLLSITHVVVTSPAGTSSAVKADQFTYTAPAITGVLPNSGSSSGGTSVTVTGTGFTGATKVTFAGSAGTNLTVVNDSTINVISPAHAIGAVNVVVTTPTGMTSGAGVGHFTYVGPAVASVLPNSGPPAGGTRVTVVGSGFTGATKVTFGTAPGTNLTVVNDSTITVTSPAHAAAVVHVLVTTQNGSSTAVVADHFTY
jgi:beta-mannanase